MSELTTTEQYVLSQLLVSGDLFEGELRELSDMSFETLQRACSGLRDKGYIGPSSLRKDPIGGYSKAKVKM